MFNLDVSQSQKERLHHIDFTLFFRGVINRNDIAKRFGVKDAAATRDITLYKSLVAENLKYDTRQKAYFRTSRFSPLFDLSGVQALTALAHGFGDDYVLSEHQAVLTERPTQLNSPQLSLLSILTCAIHQKKVVRMNYYSLSSGLTKRDIVPFALVDNGLRWHVRAFDRVRCRFTDFVINRIEKPKIRKNDEVQENEKKEADNQWNRIVDLHIVPHPQLNHPETIEVEYGMSPAKGGMMLVLQARAAVAGYILRRWNIDCSPNHKLTDPEYHLWLKNTPTLYGVQNITIAPDINVKDL